MRGHIDNEGLFRPDVSVWRGLACFTFIITVDILGPHLVLKNYFQTSSNVRIWHILITVILIELIIGLRYVLIWFVLLYQKNAPYNMRISCVYTPTCSEYSILCLRKYGAILGTLCTIERLLRCGKTDGGEDYPTLRNLWIFRTDKK